MRRTASRVGRSLYPQREVLLSEHSISLLCEEGKSGERRVRVDLTPHTGIFAGIKSGSKPSIVSSAVAAALLSYAYVHAATSLAFGTAVTLSIVFAIR